MKTSGRILIAFTGIALLVLPSTRALDAQTNGQPLRMTAFAVNMSNIATNVRSASVDINITRWSTDEERQALITTFLDKGPDELLRLLQRQPDSGVIRVPGFTGPDPNQVRLGWRLRFTRQEPAADGGRRVVIMTDRVISMWEARNRPRSFDYPFTLIEIHLDKDGRGQGKASVATRIRMNRNNQVELENFASEPVRLNNVRVTSS